MAEPSKNTYVITTILHGVRKKNALLLAEKFQITAEDSGVVDGAQTLTSHLKDFQDSP
jgi:hypothetical protein